ncbi:MAG: Endonuclease/Exonuclease/phosphatase family protein [Myxococcales bacterium]|nr:Endonuclease/Exonuclease/phosphatase family protein [Myxococcales bacterium]
MRAIGLGLLGLVGVLTLRTCRDPEPVRWRVATFNIEEFPKDQRQIDGAFDEIERLGAGLVAVQEIMRPDVFAAAARARLGADWHFVHEGGVRPGAPDAGRLTHELGLLFDRRLYTLRRVQLHDGTRLGANHKPVLDVELRKGDETFRVLVIHFKSGGDHHPTRARQYAALTPVLAEVQRTGARVILMGDFNATGEADRVDLARLTGATGTTWATEDLACSAFWDRNDGCPRSRLDHVITTERPSEVRATGACATEGCDWGASCPLYAEYVSDHCPVVLTFER